MPFWAYFYCGLFILGAFISFIDKDLSRNRLHPVAETLSCICGIYVFLIAFNKIDINYAKAFSTACFVYTNIWSFHVQKRYLNFQEFSDGIHKAGKEEQQKESNEIHVSGQSNYNYDKSERLARLIYAELIIFIAAFYVPYLYTFLLSVCVLY